jgi:hypothetical protein
MQYTKYHQDWVDAVNRLDQNKINELVKLESPKVVLFTIATIINGIYNSFKNDKYLLQLFPEAEIKISKVYQFNIDRVSLVTPYISKIRDMLGHQQRDFDIELMRFIRQSRCLSIAIGAGASIPSGCPSWAGLVIAMLKFAITKGKEIRKMIKVSGEDPLEFTTDGKIRFTSDKDTSVSYENKIIRTLQLDEIKKKEAIQIISLIEKNKYDDTVLNQGAQICYGFYGQDLFMHFTPLLYKGKTANKIHEAIAELSAGKINKNNKILPGLDSIISYNFENLMGEALEKKNIPYRAIIPLKESFGCIEKPDGLDTPYQEIYYIHGFNPRSLCRITDISYIFATSQYYNYYKKDDPANLLDYISERILANPIHVTLYIGCSFIDKYMNKLLEEAYNKFPGRWHYAILRWDDKKKYHDSSIKKINQASEKYLKMGVQPIWIDDFGEIPEILLRLK